MPAGAPYGNKNAEIWTEEDATELLNKALEMSFQPEYDFIGEIFQDLRTSRNIINHLVTKYKSLEIVYSQILENCETNCFKNAKKGKIKEATAIVNLKSNHKWTDRSENKTEHSGTITVIPPNLNED